MIGQKFNKWTVIGDIIRNENSQAFLDCKCDCGVVQRVLKSNLIHGRSGQCKKCSHAASRFAFSGKPPVKRTNGDV